MKLQTVNDTGLEIEFAPNKLATTVAQLIHKGVEIATKRLKIQSVGKNSDKRKLVISTNLLPIFGYHKGVKVCEEIIGQLQGLDVRFAELGESDSKMVYSREYKSRGYKEVLMDIRSQFKLNSGLGDAENVYIIFTYGHIRILPILDNQNINPSKLNVKLRKEGEIYAGIIDLIATLRETPYANVIVNSEEAFFESQECTLLSLQLRRLGYVITQHNKQMLAHLPKQPSNNTTVEFAQLLKQRPSKPKQLDFNQTDPLSTFAACTGGVDCYAMEQEGFNIVSALDRRPIEKRDITQKICKKTGEKIQVIDDKSETGALSALINTRSCRHIFNEDIYFFQALRFKSVLSPNNLFHISLHCSDFSPLKTLEARRKAIEELTSSRDMIFPALHTIDVIAPPAIFVENVPNFSTSIECKLFVYQLKKWGYSVYKAILNGVDFGGYTTRKRSFVFATLLPIPFAFPKARAKGPAVNVWNDVIMPKFNQLRDVSHTSSVAKGIKSGRIRTIEAGASFAPTIFKAQSRQVKDSVYVHIGNKYYLPSIEMLREFMGIDAGFDISPFTKEIQVELVGQSVEIPMHKAVMSNVKDHFMAYLKRLVPCVDKIPEPSFSF